MSPPSRISCRAWAKSASARRSQSLHLCEQNRWACLAVGVLTECEHEESQEILRKAINEDLLQSMPLFLKHGSRVDCPIVVDHPAHSN